MWPARDSLALTLLVTFVLVTVARRGRLRALRRSFADPLPARFPYRARPSLLSKTEAAFYQALKGTLGGRYAVCVKVRLADVIDCPLSVDRSA